MRQDKGNDMRHCPYERKDVVMTDRIIIICTLIVAAAYLFGTWEIPLLSTVDPLGPRTYPYLIFAGFIVSAGWLYLETRARTNIEPETPQAPEERADNRHNYVIAGVVVWLSVYFASLEPVGFLIATPVFLLALMAYLNPRKWTANIASSVLFTIGAHVLFTKVLGVPLAPGILGI